MQILIATAIVTAIGIFCAIMLVIASKCFHVEVDEKFTDIRACLPGANCGACGYTGCDGYAEALVNDPTTKTNLCIPGSDAVAAEIAEVLGVEAQDVIELTARVNCNGTCDKTSNAGVSLLPSVSCKPSIACPIVLYSVASFANPSLVPTV